MNTPDPSFGYSPAVWSHFSQPRHAGAFAAGEPGALSAQAGSPATRSLLRLSVKLQDGRVTQARFQAYGCPSAIAVGEWLAEQLGGKTVESLRSTALSAAAIRQALEIAEDRAHCALMGEDVFNALVQQM